MGPDLVQQIVIPAVQILVVILLLPLVIAYLQLVERKVLGFMQVRLAPRRVGWHGILQPIADAVKLLIKEDTVPEKADRFLFTLAPVVTVIPALAALAVIPIAGASFTLLGYEVKPWITDVNVAVLYLLAISSLGIYGIILGGWASNSKYS
ncbi:MAG TPA: complex I subunit 1 family protein, partial [Candidatus Polarisedimenticolia bacterium]|nr:complex I subunit 1 family protein [Candidatus Polarisedimenticolia bacterium]